MAVNVYPSTLPGPSVNSLQSAERRLLSSVDVGLPQVRQIQKDLHDFESLVFHFTAAQAAIFQDWFDNTLYYGGRWFTSTWLRIFNSAAVCRFIGEPAWHYAGNDYFQVTIRTEIRGVYGITAEDMSPGGARVYDLVWTIGNTQVGESLTRTGIIDFADSEVITQIVLNLAVHGQWFLDGGGIVHLTYAPSGQSVAFSLTGSGIVPQSQTSTTQRFFAVDVSASGYYTGVDRNGTIAVTIDGVAYGTAVYHTHDTSAISLDLTADVATYN